eukprot:351515-Chlamydomonas_euryale.AAC.8
MALDAMEHGQTVLWARLAGGAATAAAQDTEAAAVRRGQTGSTRSYPTSTTAGGRKERKAQRLEKDRTKQQKN